MKTVFVYTWTILVFFDYSMAGETYLRTKIAACESWRRFRSSYWTCMLWYLWRKVLALVSQMIVNAIVWNRPFLQIMFQ